MRNIVSLLDGFPSPFGNVSWSPASLFAGGEAGASWNVLGFSTIGEAIASITDSSGNDISLANAVTAQQPAYDETEDGNGYAFFDLDDSLSATLPDLGTDASKWTVTPYAVHVETGQTIGAGSYTAPTDDWGGHGVIDREITATEINRIVSWAKRNKLTGVDYPTLKTRMDVVCMNAVDVFVYDTSKDSDGGAWRNGSLAQASSWYNETLNTATRGSRREFPAVAVIVAEADKVTIYDGDDPALPMWMVFSGDNSYNSSRLLRVTSDADGNSLFALNGSICVTSARNDGGFVQFNMISEFGRYHTTAPVMYRNGAWRSPISLRNGGGLWADDGLQGIVNYFTNDVAMTVLPDAPIDPATGLPVPTIAVATDGGVSVIKDDGAVVDITSTGDSTSTFVTFNAKQKLQYQMGNRNGLRVDLIPAADFSIGSHISKGNSLEFYSPGALLSSGWGGDLRFLGSASSVDLGKTAFLENAIRSVAGLTTISRNPPAPSSGMVAYTTSTYNTGWMPGDIKGAFLADTDDTDLVGGNILLNGDFSSGSSGFLVIGTGFSITDKIVATSVPGSEYGPYADNQIQVSSDTTKQYRLRADVVVTSGAVTLRVGNAEAITCSSTQSVDVIVSPLTNGVTLFQVRATSSGFTGSIDNVVIEPVERDRSVNNNPLIVNGTVTRSPVATGAELVAYSGFSSSNYLEQPYNPALDFGTGDFCVMGWVKINTALGIRAILSRTTDNFTGGCIEIRKNSFNGSIRFSTGASGYDLNLDSSLNLPDNSWAFVVALREGGTKRLYINAQSAGTQADTSDVSNVGESLFVGNRNDGAIPWGGSLALLRISATAPTAEQIAKIYEDELPLFQEKAACTLAGSGDAVTALAHDPTTGVLRAAQSDKTSLFLGLERVGEEDGKATCIASSNGIVAGI